MSVLPEIVTRNWRLKLAAFGLAVFLWVVTRSEPTSATTQTVRNVPVRVQVGDLSWTHAGPPEPETVDVRLVTSFGALPTLGRELTVNVEIADVSSRDTVVELRREWVRTENGRSVSVEQIVPTRVRVTFEPVGNAAIPLSLTVEGSLPDDLALAAPLTLTPQVVRVHGRESRVAEIDSISVGPLDLSDVDESGTYTLRLDTESFPELTFTAEEVGVDVRVGEAVERRVEAVPVTIDSLPSGDALTDFTFEPAVIDIVLHGERTRVEGVERSELRAVVSRTAAGSIPPGGSSSVTLRVRGVPELVRAEPSAELIRVSRAEGSEDRAEPGSGDDGAGASVGGGR